MEEIEKQTIPGLTEEDTNISLELLDLSGNSKNRLKETGVHTLGDLLNFDYQELFRIRNLGERGIREIRDYVHSFGYTLKNETPFLEEVREEKRKQEVELLEDLGLSKTVYMMLYKNEIWTLEDLLNYGPNVFKIKNFGPLRRQELAEKMKDLNVTFSKSEKGEVNITVIPAQIIDKAKQDNSLVRWRISKKEQLLQEYNELMEERRNLIRRERELNEQIKAKKAQIKEIKGAWHGSKK